MRRLLDGQVEWTYVQMHIYLEHVCYLSLFCMNEERLSRLQEEMPNKISLERYKRRIAHSFLLTTF
jgi:hypothetical protein